MKKRYKCSCKGQPTDILTPSTPFKIIMFAMKPKNYIDDSNSIKKKSHHNTKKKKKKTKNI